MEEEEIQATAGGLARTLGASLTQNLSHYGKWAAEKPPEDWSRDVVLSCACRERDTIAAAIAACEQRKDSDDILEALAGHLAGERGVYFLETRLEQAGLSVQESNVLPLIPRRGGRS